MKKNSLWPAKVLLVILLCLSLWSCSLMRKNTTDIQTHVLRLKPGQDLKKSLQQFVNEHSIEAGWIVTCAGSLTNYEMRFANQSQAYSDSGHFEIVSLTGTLSKNGSHLHISISDSTGKTVGGHLMDGCIIYTTAEIVLQSSPSLRFTRQKDGSTPWQELHIESKP